MKEKDIILVIFYQKKMPILLIAMHLKNYIKIFQILDKEKRGPKPPNFIVLARTDCGLLTLSYGHLHLRGSSNRRGLWGQADLLWS